jgi:hypothetical protein
MRVRPSPKWVRLAAVLAATLPLFWLAAESAALQVREGALESARGELATARRRFDKLSRQASTTAAAPAVESASGRWQLPDEPDATGTLSVLTRLADETHVALTGLKALPTESQERVSFTVEGAGDPAAVCGFIAGVENEPRVLVVEQGTVRAADSGDGAVKFQLRVSAWHARGAR